MTHASDKQGAQMRNSTRGFTFLTLLLVIAAIALGLIGLRALFQSPSSSTGAGKLALAATRFSWVTRPDSFSKDTPTAFEVELQQYRSAGSGGWVPFGEEDTLVGAVMPPSVSIVSINGDTPATPTPIPAVPGLTAGGTAHPTSTTDAGRITFVLQGTEPADGQFSVIYMRSDGTATVETVMFSVTD